MNMQCNRCEQFEADLWDRPGTSLDPDLPQLLAACPRCAAIHEDYRLLQQAIRSARCPTDTPTFADRVVAGLTDVVRAQPTATAARRRTLMIGSASVAAASVLVLILVAQRSAPWQDRAQPLGTSTVVSSTRTLESETANATPAQVESTAEPVEPLSHSLSNAYAALARETSESVVEVTEWIGEPAPVPGNSLPGRSVPDNSVPGNSDPGGSVPGRSVPGRSVLAVIQPQMETLQGLGSVTSVSRPFEPMGREVRDAFAFLLPRSDPDPDSQTQ
jgi:hypothetical protein